jgi:two-component system response regulator PilR (NtrC family)
MCASWKTCSNAAWHWPRNRIIKADDLNLTPLEGSGLAGQDGVAGLQTHLDDLERLAIQEALNKTGHNKTAAARLLGVTFRSLRYRMERLGME